MNNVRPFKVLGWIFGGIGLLFLVLGLIFVFVSADLLPQLANPEVWLDETPDELALPVVGVVFSGIGGVFTVLGGAFLFVDRRQQLLREELERFGMRVQGVVADIVIDRNYRVNGRSPLRIMAQAQHPVTGETKTLRGPLVWETALSTGDAVEVLFDPQDEKKYLVLCAKPEDAMRGY